MTIPSAATAGYAALLAEGIIDDPWHAGTSRLSTTPVWVTPREASDLAAAGVALALILDEAVQAVTTDPAIGRDLGMDESLMQVALLDAPRWLALARADVFLLDDPEAPAQVCELNCDTPTGLAECWELGRLALSHTSRMQPRGPPGRDPSAQLRQRWLAMVLGALPGPGSSSLAAAPTVGIVEATEMTEDLCHMRILRRWLEEAGFQVVRGSPFNLHACPGGRVAMFGTACDVLIRHYKSDWWSRRSCPWKDQEPPPHAAPLWRELDLVRQAQAAGTVAVINPFGAAIAQNKRALALPWEIPELFSSEALALARRHLPETRFLESLPLTQLIAEQDAWVLKSDYGCEGDEVFVGAQVPPSLWAESLGRAAPGHWVVQRAFAPRRDASGRIANHGVFLIGGRPSGLYTRRSTGPTDGAAESCGTLVQP